MVMKNIPCIKSSPQWTGYWAQKHVYLYNLYVPVPTQQVYWQHHNTSFTLKSAPGPGDMVFYVWWEHICPWYTSALVQLQSQAIA